jgi:indolepyruvate ferredoxin oxidoreductase
MVVAHGKNGLPMMSADRTAVVTDNRVMPTAEFVANNSVKYDASSMEVRLKANTRSLDECPAQAIATALLGDAIFANMVLTGFAWQKGLIPLDRGAIMRAIELNRASVGLNKRAFEIGREAAADPARVMAKVAPPPKLSQTLDELIEIRVSELIAYQNAAYADRYRAFVEKVRAAERAVAPKSEVLSEAVARNLYKLMAIKDEYEIARLYTDGAFEKRLKEKFEGKVKLAIHLAAPILGHRNPDTGLLEKRAFGGWMLKAMKVLAKGKRLRGTRLDLFGRTAERKAERALIQDYEARMEKVLPALNEANLNLAAAYAGVPDMIRGFGHVKAANMKKAEARYAEFEAALLAPAQALQAAE